jgi:hypothetical protein
LGQKETAGRWQAAAAAGRTRSVPPIVPHTAQHNVCPKAGDSAAGKLLPVGQEGVDALVGQRVLGRLLQNLVRAGRDVGAGFGRLDDVQGVADAGGEDERRQVVPAVDCNRAK